ncbi:MAG: hypothetical protein QY329_10275 [Anaerolineales bacterium]|nr:MAG: hypothetical protein QY329_10275 [Anaerolineales bacterium]
MYSIKFYARVVRALDEIGAPYMIVGAFAGIPFGITRTTFDIDILVDLREQDFDALSAKFPLPRYYADPEMMRNSTQMGIMFNIIDSSEGIKADLVPLKREPEYQAAFNHRVRKKFSDGETNFEAWCARPEDIIIGKLYAWQEGQSSKHPADIKSMLLFVLSKDSDIAFDQDIVSAAAAKISPEALTLWKDLVAQTKKEL